MQEWERDLEWRKFLAIALAGFLLILVGAGLAFVSILLGVLAIFGGVGLLIVALQLRDNRRRRGQGR